MSDVTRVSITGLQVVSALGRGAEAQLAAALPGAAAFTEVQRFDTGNRRVHRAATAADVVSLEEELLNAITGACAEAGLTPAQRATTPLFLAVHGRAGVRGLVSRASRIYTSACVSASTAVADAAALIRQGYAERIVVAAGYLVEPDQFALFDAGRALADDGVVRPFSGDRRGLLLGDGVAAVVLQRGEGLAEIAGWGRAGDAYHPCQPAPDGHGLAAAMEAALRKADLPPEVVGYINANATGTSFSDASEAAAIRTVFAGPVPVSSTKAVHGHALVASGLLELVMTVQALREGKLPVNAGFTTPDPDCDLELILDAPRPVTAQYGLSLNAAFGGANTALLVRAG
ncbi:beta-ketoacyl synthase N-terminal-like domain-containing protein [Kribbella sancticallisti]|uniref:Beta-ketoacyl synthase N-terminal-like domain-containing protein n=1 Tax=Kribbella sancticallisti TaxID=460087 RepID=A0ABN2EL11_9ACTN